MKIIIVFIDCLRNKFDLLDNDIFLRFFYSNLNKFYFIFNFSKYNIVEGNKNDGMLSK